MAPSDEPEIDTLLQALESGDLELEEPPPEIWSAIAAAVETERRAARAARTAPTNGHSTNLVVEYRIDAADRVVPIGAGWAAFARENGAPQLEQLSGTLWDAIESESCRDLWKSIVAHARVNGATLRVPLRCDAPHARRWFEMVITPEADAHVHFASTLVFEEPRYPVALLDAAITRDAEAPTIALCTWCGQAEYDGRWLRIEEMLRTSRILEAAAVPPVAHGVCTGCRDDMHAQLAVAVSAQR